MTSSHALVKRAADHGRHIFIYNNFQTNQVIYSLERSMNNNAALKQLTYAGKTTIPASLRKDLWQPLLTVTFPSAPQGLAAYRKLREFRRLHELNWDPAEAKRLGEEWKSESKRREDKERLEQYKRDVGGPRNPRTDFKKARARLIQDQKANSIADLAAVLAEHETIGFTSERLKAESLSEKVRKAATEVGLLIKESHEAVLVKHRAIGSLLGRYNTKELNPEYSRNVNAQQLLEIRAHLAAEQGVPQEDVSDEDVELRRKQAETMTLTPEYKATLKREYNLITEKLKTMDIAGRIMKLAESLHQKDGLLAANANEGSESKTEGSESKTEGSESKTEVQGGFDLETMLKRDEFQELIEELNPETRKKVMPANIMTPLPKRGPMRAILKAERRPEFTTQGVRIQWANPLDAEYAMSWPRQVQHDIVGLTRHILPRPSDSPVLDVSEKTRFNLSLKKLARIKALEARLAAKLAEKERREAKKEAEKQERIRINEEKMLRQRERRIKAGLPALKSGKRKLANAM